MNEERNKTGLALAGAVVGAFAASLCCTLPLIAAVLGATGFGAAGWFAPWRPYLLAMTFALLALGFYLAYRPASRTCEPGSVCETKPVARWSRSVLWLITIIVVVLAAFPYYSGWVARAVTRSKQPTAVIRMSSPEKLVLKIDGMDCPLCAGSLQNKLRQVPGVQRAEVSFQDKQATIEYDPRAVGPTSFEKLVADAGFKVGARTANK